MSKAANFLQTAGIASQASDGFDRMRQSDRLAAQGEQMNQMKIDENILFREIVKLAYANEEARRASAATKKPAAGPAVLAPTAPGMADPATVDADDQERGQAIPGYADGGVIPGVTPGMEAEKFDGIYDDSKISNGQRMPTIYNEWARDSKTMMANGGFIQSLMGIDSTMQEYGMANGGMVPGPGTTNDVYTPASFANGGMICNRIRGCMPQKAAVKQRGKKQKIVKKRDGGAVRGPGTGTSDSVPAVGPGGRPFALSDGEYVLSADTVQAVGKENLDALQARYHKPV